MKNARQFWRQKTLVTIKHGLLQNKTTRNMREKGICEMTGKKKKCLEKRKKKFFPFFFLLPYLHFLPEVSRLSLASHHDHQEDQRV